MNNKRLVRPKDDRMIAGVAAGLADYFDIDPVIARLIFLVLFLGGGPGLILYILLWIIMPEAPGGAKANSFHEDEIRVGGSA